MVKDSLKSLREPIAWILVSAVAAEFLVGLWNLFEKPKSDYQQENWFLYNSYYGTSYFLSFATAAMLVAALLVVTVLPDRLPRAKPIVLIVAVESGVMILLGVLSLFLGLFYTARSSVSGTSVGPDGVDKAQSFLGELPEVALMVVPLLLALAAVRAAELSGAAPQQQAGLYAPQQPYPQQPYPQQQPGFPPQQGFPGPQQQQGYPGSFPEWGGPPQQGGGYGQGW